MISKIVVSLLFSVSAFAGNTLMIKGKVLRVENGVAVIAKTGGENRLELKKLAKQDVKTINSAVGSKKDIELHVPFQILTQN